MSRWHPGFRVGYLGICFENVPEISGGLLISFIQLAEGRTRKKNVTNRCREVAVNCKYL